MIAANVKSKIESYPAHIQPKILKLRALILSVAADMPEVGPLTETLKWGEPAYLTQASKSGSTIRIAYSDKRPSQYGMYFNCNTTLVDTFRSLFGAVLNFEGNRAIIFKLEAGSSQKDWDKDALSICIAKALTYHMSK